MSANAVSDAKGLLRQRRSDAIQQQRELADEVRRIDDALNALEGLPAEIGPSPERLSPGPGSSNGQKSSVRAAVLAVLEAEANDWTPALLTAEIQRRGFQVKVSNLGDAVRTALWGLGKDGRVTRTDSGQYLATKWRLAKDDDRA